MHLTLREEAEREILLWVARFVGESRGKLSRIEALGIMDSALELRRAVAVNQLKASREGRSEAEALEREG